MSELGEKTMSHVNAYADEFEKEFGEQGWRIATFVWKPNEHSTSHIVGNCVGQLLNQVLLGRLYTLVVVEPSDDPNLPAPHMVCAGNMSARQVAWAMGEAVCERATQERDAQVALLRSLPPGTDTPQ